jgi:hypothetical protein
MDIGFPQPQGDVQRPKAAAQPPTARVPGDCYGHSTSGGWGGFWLAGNAIQAVKEQGTESDRKMIGRKMTHKPEAPARKCMVPTIGALPRNLWVVFALLSGATVAFSQAWLGRSMAGRKKVALAM